MTCAQIPPAEIQWINDSFVDPSARVFEWRGEIYRAIHPSHVAFWQDLFDNGTVRELIRDKLLVSSEVTELESDPGTLVVHHKKVPVVSYCFEWSPGMLKKAALLTLDLCIRLAEKELTLQDAHPWNVLFEGPIPVFIDLGSITPARQDIIWAPYQQFCNFFLFPLYLYSANCDRLARWLLRDYLYGVTEDDALAALPSSFKLLHPGRTFRIWGPRLIAKALHYLPQPWRDQFLSFAQAANSNLVHIGVRIKFLESLRKDIETLKFDRRRSQWTDYYETVDKNYFATDISPGEWHLKQQAVNRLITELAPRSVLDVGANTGQYAMLAASSGARVIACDLDVPAVDICYREACRKRLDLLPLVSNVFSVSPFPGRGGVAYPPATTRFRSDLVLGLALIHHVVAIQRLDISRIVDIFDRLAERFLLLEFVRPLAPSVGGAVVESLDDYCLEDLERRLRQSFAKVSLHPSYPDDRKLLLCER
jgi:SAM-dependent methyltransferase